MKLAVKHTLGIFAVVAVAMSLALVPLALSADHLDQPFPVLPSNIDITDLYAFHPGEIGSQDLSKVVFVLNVHPLTSPGLDPAFSSDATYIIKVDTDGDAEEDIVYEFEFGSPDADGRQEVTVEEDEEDQFEASGMTEDIISVADGSWLFAGLRDDPFFFDFAAFGGAKPFCDPDPSPDTFKGFNVKSIVLEVPTDSLFDDDFFDDDEKDGEKDGKKGDDEDDEDDERDGSTIGVWATIELDDDQQQDRMGRPAINTVLISTDNKAAFNAGDPEDDFEDFSEDVIASLNALNPGDPARAEFLASVLLPDILVFDTSLESDFSMLNGRNLADDVIDIELGLLTAGALPGDCVDANDVAFLGAFPYVAPPHA